MTSPPPQPGPPEEFQQIFRYVSQQAGTGAYTNSDGTTFSGFEEQKKSKAEARMEAVEQFKAAAVKTTKGQIYNLMNQLMANLVQLRAVEGTLVGTEIPEMMRGALAFMEDQ